jgi:NAD(P)-dependent dehydrogenase (short-subunit alcohol dehydrogenase family)
VTGDGFAQRFVQTAVDDFGSLDIIVNNAGYTWDSVIQKITDAGGRHHGRSRQGALSHFARSTTGHLRRPSRKPRTPVRLFRAA